MDRYGDFHELSRHHVEGEDYRIHKRLRTSPYAVMAIHGGLIERGTMPIADLIASDEHTFYCFEALGRASRQLHITSNRYNEPAALDIAASVETVITVHGAAGQAEEVYLGGRDEELKDRIIKALNRKGFPARHDPSPTRQGRGRTNICNRGRSGKGVQLELPQGLRKSMFIRPAGNNTRWKPGQRLYEFSGIIREVLNYNT